MVAMNAFQSNLRIYKDIIFFLISLLIVNSSCFFRGKSNNSFNTLTQNYREGHYIYEDNLLILSAKIKQSEIPGGYEYELLIVNNNIDPITLNYYNDILTLYHQDRIYSLGKLTHYSLYPDKLDPGQGFKVIFQVDGIFSAAIYEIQELFFKLGEKRFTLQRNPAANWPQQ